MRIISNFPDYYDSIMSFDKDDLIYERYSISFCMEDVVKEELHLVGDYKCVPSAGLFFKNMKPVGCRIMIVGFCGELYPLLEIDYNVKKEGRILGAINRVRFYNQKDLDHFLLEMRIRSSGKRNDSSLVNLHKICFSNIKNKIDQYREWIVGLFIKLRVPVFLIRKDPEEKDWACDGVYNDIIEINPCLKNISFQKVFDTFSAFQEINMYLGGVLTRPERPILHISDEIRARQHGYDKNSFRMMKGDKKPRKLSRGKKH